MRVSGHGLQHEGRPVMSRDCCGVPSSHQKRNTYDQHGHALCACGAMSEHMLTTAERQRWHRAHKDEIVAARA